MNAQSIVYGCIRDSETTCERVRRNHDAHNLQTLAQLPEREPWTLLAREMFSVSAPPGGIDGPRVIHFAASYGAVEYEWRAWMEAFEALLRQLYWSIAVVHLETEASGLHTFRWQAEESSHHADAPLKVRCAWERESHVGA